MYRVTREIDFCYGHRLLNYAGKCRHLHGHNGKAVIVLEAADLDERGMLVDFTDIKRQIQTWIDDHLDHNMLLCKDDPLLPVLRERGERVFVMDANPTAENIARLIFEHGREVGLPVISVTLWETPNCNASYGLAAVQRGVVEASGVGTCVELSGAACLTGEEQ
jgi:6-pyruvoyltetrahydropterin/6-carboxytetrahydropterin synthase